MIGTVLGIILCVIFGFFAVNAMVVNHEEHEKRRLEKEKQND